MGWVDSMMSGVCFADSEDVEQDIALQAIESGNDWLRGMNWKRRHVAINYRNKKAASLLPSGYDASGSVPGPLAEAIRREECAMIRDAIDRLPERDQVAIRASYWDGLSCNEIAAKFGWSCSWVKRSIEKSRESIKERLVCGRYCG